MRGSIASDRCTVKLDLDCNMGLFYRRASSRCVTRLRDSAAALSLARAWNAQDLPVFRHRAACYLNALVVQLLGKRLVGQRFAWIFVVDQLAQHGLDGGG